MMTDKTEIEQWLRKYKIENYSIRSDGIVDVDGNVNIASIRRSNMKKLDLDGLPVKFGIVEGDFDCSEHRLKSMVGCPDVVRGNFTCKSNLIESLEGSPRVVLRSYDISYNKLTSLAGIADKIHHLGWMLKIAGNPFIDSLLGTITFEGIRLCAGLDTLPDAVRRILRLYQGKSDLIFECQQELIDAGFEAFARL